MTPQSGLRIAWWVQCRLKRAGAIRRKLKKQFIAKLEAELEKERLIEESNEEPRRLEYFTSTPFRWNTQPLKDYIKFHFPNWSGMKPQINKDWDKSEIKYAFKEWLDTVVVEEYKLALERDKKREEDELQKLYDFFKPRDWGIEKLKGRDKFRQQLKRYMTIANRVEIGEKTRRKYFKRRYSFHVIGTDIYTLTWYAKKKRSHWLSRIWLSNLPTFYTQDRYTNILMHIFSGKRKKKTINCRCYLSCSCWYLFNAIFKILLFILRCF